MKCDPDRTVFVTEHAYAQARKRWDDLRDLTRQEVMRLLVGEVSASIRAGRVSRRQPRSTVWNGGTRAKAWHGRFVSNAAGDHVYLVREDEGRVVVVTCFKVKREALAA